jgi:hypothetical protein
MRGAGREARKKIVGNSDVTQEQLTICLWVLNILFFGPQVSVKRVGTDDIGRLDDWNIIQSSIPITAFVTQSTFKPMFYFQTLMFTACKYIVYIYIDIHHLRFVASNTGTSRQIPD